MDRPSPSTLAVAERLRAAEQALVRLELAGAMVPSVDWFIYAFVRKEAVVSSQIEGTEATLVDLLTFEAEEDASPPGADVEEICSYLDALAYARGQLAEPKGLPLSMRLLNETHLRLMRGVRGSDRQPGEIRHTQNWIGGTRPGNAVFVPPPPHVLRESRRPRRDVVRLEDGRELRIPLEWYPALRDATDEQRADWRFIGGGIGVHWEQLDEDLSVRGMLAPNLAAAARHKSA